MSIQQQMAAKYLHSPSSSPFPHNFQSNSQLGHEQFFRLVRQNKHNQAYDLGMRMKARNKCSMEILKFCRFIKLNFLSLDAMDDDQAQCSEQSEQTSSSSSSSASSSDSSEPPTRKYKKTKKVQKGKNNYSSNPNFRIKTLEPKPNIKQSNKKETSENKSNPRTSLGILKPIANSSKTNSMAKRQIKEPIKLQVVRQQNLNLAYFPETLSNIHNQKCQNQFYTSLKVRKQRPLRI